MKDSLKRSSFLTGATPISESKCTCLLLQKLISGRQRLCCTRTMCEICLITICYEITKGEALFSTILRQQLFYLRVPCLLYGFLWVMPSCCRQSSTAVCPIPWHCGGLWLSREQKSSLRTNRLGLK